MQLTHTKEEREKAITALMDRFGWPRRNAAAIYEDVMQKRQIEARLIKDLLAAV